MQILTLEPMSYKEQKRENELLTKLRILKLHRIGKYTKSNIAQSFSCSRNTIKGIIDSFDKYIPKSDQDSLLYSQQDLKSIEEKLKPLLSKSTKPKSRHPKQATKEQEEKIVDIFNNYLRVGPKRLRRHLKRGYGRKGNKHKRVSQLERSLSELSLAQIKGVYKRNNLKLDKMRTYNKEVVPLYDYRSIAAFEYMHLDTKHILDQGALPETIYQNFDLNSQLPIYEWNLIDAKSRFRFIAYSHNLTSEFGFKFLISTLQYIRGCVSNYDQHIHVLTDNGIEFFSGSERKKAEWNQMLEVINADIDSYEPGHDVRKNLIERSHKTDDEEFFVPRGDFIYDEESFLNEAREYSYYYNALRPHSGVGMKDRTPLEVLQDTGLTGTHKLLNYPTLILEKSVRTISSVVSTVDLQEELTRNRLKYSTDLDQKVWRDLLVRFPFLSENAQNVLTPYQFFILQMASLPLQACLGLH